MAGTYTAPATDAKILKSFYKSVRPWGFWQPVHKLVTGELSGFIANHNFKLDIFNVLLGGDRAMLLRLATDVSDFMAATTFAGGNLYSNNHYFYS